MDTPAGGMEGRAATKRQLDLLPPDLEEDNSHLSVFETDSDGQSSLETVSELMTTEGPTSGDILHFPAMPIRTKVDLIVSRTPAKRARCDISSPEAVEMAPSAEQDPDCDHSCTASSTPRSARGLETGRTDPDPPAEQWSKVTARGRPPPPRPNPSVGGGARVWTGPNALADPLSIGQPIILSSSRRIRRAEFCSNSLLPGRENGYCEQPFLASQVPCVSYPVESGLCRVRLRSNKVACSDWTNCLETLRSPPANRNPLWSESFGAFPRREALRPKFWPT